MGKPNDQNPDKNESSKDTAEPYPWREGEPDETGPTGPPQDSPEPERRSKDGPPSDSSPGEQSGGSETRPPDRDQSAREPHQQGVEKAGSGSKYSDEVPEERSIFAKVLKLLLAGLGVIQRFLLYGIHRSLIVISGRTKSHKGLSKHFYPDYMIRDDEEVLISGNPSRWLFPVPYIVGGALVSLAVVITGAVLFGYGEPLLDAVTPSVIDLSVPDKWWYAPIVFICAATIILLYAAIKRASVWHIVTDKRLLHREKILAPNKTQLDLVDVKSIDCRQPMPERWYGVGHIDIYTASTGGREVVLVGVKGANSVAKRIDKIRYDYQQRIRGGYGDEGLPEHQQRSAQEKPQQDPQSSARQEPQSGGNEKSPQQSSSPSHHRDQPNKRHHQNEKAPSQHRNRSDGGPPSESVEGGSIEDQRPSHTLRDEMGETRDRDER